MDNHRLKIMGNLIHFCELDHFLSKAPKYIKGMMFKIINLVKWTYDASGVMSNMSTEALMNIVFWLTLRKAEAEDKSWFW